MTIPLVPMLPEAAYVIGALFHGIVCVVDWFKPIYPTIRIMDEGDDWRVVKKFLFTPLTRLDRHGYDWMDYRPVYQILLGEEWIDMWVVTDSLGR